MMNIGHFVLTEALLPKMEETAKETGMQGRIINVSSMIHKWVNPQGFHLHHMLKPKEYVMLLLLDCLVMNLFQ